MRPCESSLERIARPTLTEDGRRAPALRFGDPRVQALAGALCTTTTLVVTSITNEAATQLAADALSSGQAVSELAVSQGLVSPDKLASIL
ncbi:hypothetical protein ACFXG4_51590, partial [Nocardia sp. NPDC059246]|uniref:hypothetical protein n=1 Tax=unclassified Nocardia TaxID=2637762 RepID=UPI0036A45F59